MRIPPKPTFELLLGYFIFSGISGLVLSGPVLRDTARLSLRYPPIARYGVFGVSTWPIGCDTPPPPFLSDSPLGEHAKWRCDTPPQKGYLSDTGAIPYENKANACDTSLCDTISKGYCAIWGGVSRIGPLRSCGSRGPSAGVATLKNHGKTFAAKGKWYNVHRAL